jgi:hypothetical protein
MGAHGVGPTPVSGGLLRMFRPHLPEKYDGTVNPIELLQIYSTSILVVGGNEAIMASDICVALIGTARSWLMNLPEGTLDSWSELCHQFMANFDSAYARPAMRPTSTPSSNAQGNPYVPSSSGSLRFAIPFHVSPMLQWWLHFARE